MLEMIFLSPMCILTGTSFESLKTAFKWKFVFAFWVLKVPKHKRLKLCILLVIEIEKTCQTLWTTILTINKENVQKMSVAEMTMLRWASGNMLKDRIRIMMSASVKS